MSNIKIEYPFKESHIKSLINIFLERDITLSELVEILNKAEPSQCAGVWVKADEETMKRMPVTPVPLKVEMESHTYYNTGNKSIIQHTQTYGQVKAVYWLDESQQQFAGVWVYPPELPKTAGTYIVEFTTKHVERCTFYGDKKQFFVGSDNVTEYVKRWLDESQQQPVLDEEIEKMIANNDNIFRDKYNLNSLDNWHGFFCGIYEGFKAALRKQVLQGISDEEIFNFINDCITEKWNAMQAGDIFRARFNKQVWDCSDIAVKFLEYIMMGNVWILVECDDICIWENVAGERKSTSALFSYFFNEVYNKK